MSKICSSCGSVFDDSDSTCPSCGTRQEPDVQSSRKKSEKNSPVLIVIAVILSIIIITGSIFLVYLLKNRKEVKENGNASAQYSVQPRNNAEQLTKPVTLAAADISDSELQDAVHSGKVSGRITHDTPAAMTEIVQLAKQTDSYAEVPTGQAMSRISEITGKSFSSSSLGSAVSAAESDSNLAVKFPSDSGSETFLIFSKNKNAVYTISSADIYSGYLKVYKMNYDCVEKILTGQGIDDCDIFWVSDSTHETLLTSHKSGSFVFYYDYNGELIVCLKNSGDSIKSFDSGFNAVDEEALKKIFSDALIEIQNRFGLNIKL